MSLRVLRVHQLGLALAHVVDTHLQLGVLGSHDDQTAATELRVIAYPELSTRPATLGGHGVGGGVVVVGCKGIEV